MDISGKRMYSLLRKLDFERLSTFEGEKKAADIIAEEIRNAGAEPIIETFDAPHYEIKNVKVQGDNYIAEITVYENNENDSNTNNMKIIIQLLDGTNFKILFQN